MSPTRRDQADVDALRASLLDHARDLIARDGAAALTMRALAVEAGCAVGLPYKVFADRHDLVAEICHAEFGRLAGAHHELTERTGTATVGANLMWFAELLLDSPAVGLAHEVFADDATAKTITARVHETGIRPASFEAAFASYLAAEKKVGRVAPNTDEAAFGFLLAGAVHNLIMSGDAWPQPSRRRLRRHLNALAKTIAVES